MYPNWNPGDPPAGGGIVRADHVVIGTKQYGFVIQGDTRDPLGERVAFRMDRARQTPLEQSDLKLAHANQEVAQQMETTRHQEPVHVPEERMRRVLAP